MSQTYDKKISIEKILNSRDYANTFQVIDPDFQIILDTSSVKRIPRTIDHQYLFCHKKELGGKYNLVLTNGIEGEVNHLDSIPPSLRDFIGSIKYRTINHQTPKTNEIMIKSINYDLKNSKIGSWDIQMLSYAMERARDGKQTALISDDAHILRITSYLRKKSSERKIFKPNMFAFDIQRPINALFPNIDKNYMVA